MVRIIPKTMTEVTNTNNSQGEQISNHNCNPSDEDVTCQENNDSEGNSANDGRETENAHPIQPNESQEPVVKSPSLTSIDLNQTVKPPCEPSAPPWEPGTPYGASVPHQTTSPRQQSTSNCSSSSSSGEICRICHGEAEPDAPLISPCICCGSLKYLHQACLQQWIKSSDTRYCELCKFEFVMKITTKPFNQWKFLDMSSLERRKIICSVSFHTVALTCVVWALYVLIERTTEEINHGELDWPFWTKLIVVAVGFTGGVVFMYVQCRMYSGLCRRWRSYNRIFLVQNIPPDMLEKSQKAAKEKLMSLQYGCATSNSAPQALPVMILPAIISSSNCTIQIPSPLNNCSTQADDNAPHQVSTTLPLSSSAATGPGQPTDSSDVV